MNYGLFDRIHDTNDWTPSGRNYPATLDEFLHFGLSLEDYTEYIGLQFALQGTIISSRYISSLAKDEDGAPLDSAVFNRLVSFCRDKGLISDPELAKHPHDDIAMYYHDWMRLPRDSSDFRLDVERSLSICWDDRDAYIEHLFNEHYDFLMDNPDDYDSSIRVRVYDLETRSFRFLSRCEIQTLLNIVKEDHQKTNSQYQNHMSNKPMQSDINLDKCALSWLQNEWSIIDKRTAAEDLIEMLEAALNAPDIHQINEADVLYVLTGEDDCKESTHLLSDIKAQFSIYGKKDAYYSIRRCAHCKQYQILLEDFMTMINSIGIPRCQIIYCRNGEIDSTSFADTSVFYDMGYTVSQAAGLSPSQRQRILKYAIDTGKASKYEVISFLKQRMNINGMKPGNEIAFQKWKEDCDYIRSL